MTENKVPATEAELLDIISNANDLQEELVFVPEWNATILVRGMTGRERDKFTRKLALYREKWQKDANFADPSAAELIIATCRHPTSKKLLFNQIHTDMILSKSGTSLERVTQVALRLSGLTPEFIAEIRKNSSGAANDDSTTLSPKNSDTLTST